MIKSQMQVSQTEVVAENGVVAGGHPLEAEAGVRVMQEGGNAIDALVASAFVGFVVEPESCGIGGYGRLSIYLAETKTFVTIDHYVRAPLQSRPDMFELDTETPWHYYGHPKTKGLQAERGYLSPAVPGAVAGLHEAHSRFGKLPWEQVLAPAIEIAKAGVPVSWRLSLTIGTMIDQLNQFPQLAHFLLQNGRAPNFKNAWANGHKLDTTDLANTLQLIAEKGPAGFYEGAIAAAIEKKIKAGGGILTAADLAAYQPKILHEKPCRYRNSHYISAYDQVAYEVLNILDRFDLKQYGPNSLEFRHLVAEALGHGFIDNKVHYGDPDYVQSPVAGLTSRAFANSRNIRLDQAAPRPIQPADPWPYETEVLKPDIISNSPTLGRNSGTSQMVTADKAGNFCALITSISSAFGSLVMVPGTGIILNNSMQNFDPRPEHPNGIQPGKMPIFAAPSLVATQDGQAIFAGAGSGGYRIMTGVLHAFLHHIDFDMPIQDAIDAPRVHCQGQETAVDSRIPVEIQQKLAEMGHQVEVTFETPGSNYYGRIAGIHRDLKTGLLHAGSGPAWTTSTAGF
ncbi:MAG: gamma-glutamyltransferase family protein [Chloroflexota bacterium]